MSGDLLIRAGLSDNPALAEEIGNLNVAWATLELRVFQIFLILTNLPVPVARAIYYSLRTTASRLELTTAVARIVLRKKPTRIKPPRRKPLQLGAPLKAQGKLTKILGDIGRMAGQRNKYVHDPWVGHATNRRAYQMRLNDKEIRASYEPVRVRDVRRLTLKIETKSSALRRFREAQEPKMMSLHGILESEHDLFLVPAKKPTPKAKKAKPQSQPRSSRP
ncbi:MAG TPA: hypothetical protein VK438_12585 [Xanthobacteraceae bacterium]|nr:hypothetical protein [Xanthobacteraceae bacterium]